MRQRRAPFVAGLFFEVKAKPRPGSELDPASREAAEAQLRPLQIRQDADRPSRYAFHGPDRVEAGSVFRVRTMAEIQAEHIDAGVEQSADPLRRRARRPEGRNNFR